MKTFRILKFKRQTNIWSQRCSKSFDGIRFKKPSVKVYPGECVGILGQTDVEKHVKQCV